MTDTLGPLGLLKEFQESLEESALVPLLQKLQQIESFDLTGPRSACHRELKLAGRHDSPELLERELKRFLSLDLCFPSHKYPWVPSRPVDNLWHHFILDTQDYQHFCDSLFGYYIHHVPSESRGKTLAEVGGEMYAFTFCRLDQAYGAPPPSVWGVTGRCNTIGTCHEVCNSP